MVGSDGKDCKRLLVATHNAGKLAELRDLLREAPYSLVSLSDVGIEVDVDETGETLEENAALKATTYARLAGLPTLADDSGLEVDALGGAPGVHSARYAGPNATDADRIAKLLDNLAVRTAAVDGALSLRHCHRHARRSHRAIQRRLRGSYNLQAARRQRLRVRPRVPSAGARQDDGGAVRRGEERCQSSRRCGARGGACAYRGG